MKLTLLPCQLVESIFSYLESTDICTVHQLNHETIQLFKENASLWELSLQVCPIYGDNRILLGQSASETTQQYCFRLLNLIDRINKSTSLPVLTVTLSHYSDISGVATAIYKRISELSESDDDIKLLTHRYQLHLILSKEVEKSYNTDTRRCSICLEAIQMILRPFNNGTLIHPMQSISVVNLSDENFSQPIYECIQTWSRATDRNRNPLLTIALRTCVNIALFPKQATFLRRNDIYTLMKVIITHALSHTTTTTHTTSYTTNNSVYNTDIVLYSIKIMRNVTDTQRVDTHTLHIITELSQQICSIFICNEKGHNSDPSYHIDIISQCIDFLLSLTIWNQRDMQQSYTIITYINTIYNDLLEYEHYYQDLTYGKLSIPIHARKVDTYNPIKLDINNNTMNTTTTTITDNNNSDTTTTNNNNNNNHNNNHNNSTAVTNYSDLNKTYTSYQRYNQLQHQQFSYACDDVCVDDVAKTLFKVKSRALTLVLIINRQL